MPYRRSYRKSNSRRRFRKSFKRPGKFHSRRGKSSAYRRTKVKIPTRIMPDYTLVKMKDTRVILLDPGQLPQAGSYSVSNTYISGNDIYNAWQGANAQPLEGQPSGFSQWAAFYRNFIVHKSSLKVTPLYWVTSPTTDAPLPFQLTVTPVDANNLTTFDTSFDEQPYSRFKMFNGVLLGTSSTTVDAPPNTGTQTFQSVINSMMTKKILGYKTLSDVPEVQGQMDTGTTIDDTKSPVNEFYWNIECKSLVLQPPGGTSFDYSLSGLAVKVDIYYKVQLLNRRNVLDSGNDQEA